LRCHARAVFENANEFVAAGSLALEYPAGICVGLARTRFSALALVGVIAGFGDAATEASAAFTETSDFGADAASYFGVDVLGEAVEPDVEGIVEEGSCEQKHIKSKIIRL
jgi:hypothetical protein